MGIKTIVENRYQYLLANKDRLVIDADTHISDLSESGSEVVTMMSGNPDYYHGRPISAKDLINEMQMANVDMSLTWQNPAATIYPGTKEANYEALKTANRYIFNSTEKYPGRFIPAGWTDPRALGRDLALKLIEVCVLEFGFPVVKLNPAQNAFPIDSELVAEATEKIISLGAVPAFHYGADTVYTPAKGLRKLARMFPGSPIIAVHMGGGGAGYVEAEGLYRESRQLGLEEKNVFFVLSARRDTHTESDLISYQLAGEPFRSKLCCASDAPYGRQTWNFGGYKAMFKSLKDASHHTDPRVRENPGLFTDDSVKKYMGGNIANLALKGYEGILSHL